MEKPDNQENEQTYTSVRPNCPNGWGDWDPILNDKWLRGTKATESALRLGLITEDDIVDD